MALISGIYHTTPGYSATTSHKRPKRPQWLKDKISAVQHGRKKRRKWMNAQAGTTIAFKPSKSKTKPNACEALFKIKAEQAGWTVSHKGWPDFICWRGEELCVVEVKPDVGDIHLRKEQKEVMKTLSAVGIRCYKWSPEKGFEVILPNLKQREALSKPR